MDTVRQFAEFNLVTIVLACVILFSVWQGVSRGASGSVRHLFFIILETCLTVISLLLSYLAAQALSPTVATWLQEMVIKIPSHEWSWWERMYYTTVTSIRDFALLRFALLFSVLYILIRSIIGVLARLVMTLLAPSSADDIPSSQRHSDQVLRRQDLHQTPNKPLVIRFLSRVVGAMVGIVTGSVRAFFIVVLLFGYVTLQQDTAVSRMVQSSAAYQAAANQVIQPLAGAWVTKQLPVFTAQVEEQLSDLMQRKYEVIDYLIPQDIEKAALEVTKGARSDEEKARKLYNWVGTRVKYDWSKANNYIQRGEWKEQTPEETFDSKSGVCIDYARLYAVMARTVGLEVRVVTGKGYDGKGGYGPHAWNTVKLVDRGWIPLDATWASTGDWFNPPNFDATHIPDKGAISNS
ncbi:transglutaminase-like domain-containing protein [Paenibacillus sp. ACRRX]|uniref:transglutaminase-like domain-containing protein n=1 Tax=Paenibacillus sp. ACRRX TaxID=2918206 RepID=UPI001EF594FF|nr:transglutaminase-like domain-containing protein [Paenibacillus sp. ACRRX]MCG7410440.1 transglutaminase-like domain-containing protein [Paenibacillus sp. ACRRX]